MRVCVREIGVLVVLMIVGMSSAHGAPAQSAASSALDRIPSAALDGTTRPPAESDFSATTSVEEDPEFIERRSSFVVPLPGNPEPTVVNRLFLDSRGEWRISDAWRFLYSGRGEIYLQNEGPTFVTHATGLTTLNYQFREGYFSWSAGGRRLWFLDIGRINVRNGVAYAFNPTDFFRTEAVVDQISQDPAELRDDRLGTVMIRVQGFVAGSTLTALYAPRLYRRPLPLDQPVSSLDPQIRRTNAASRAEFAVSRQLPYGIHLQVLAYREGSRWAYGENLSAGLGVQTTAYVEWSGSRRSALPVEAMNYAVRTGTFPDAVSPVAVSLSKTFVQEWATGLSYTSGEGINLTVEYDMSQLGLSSAQWREWFAVGTSGLQDEKLWYLRQYASAQQDPLYRQSLFIRVARDHWLVRDLSASAFCIFDMTGGSSLAQGELNYRLSSRLGIDMLVQHASGSRRSDFGSAPFESAYFLRIKWYL